MEYFLFCRQVSKILDYGGQLFLAHGLENWGLKSQGWESRWGIVPWNKNSSPARVLAHCLSPFGCCNKIPRTGKYHWLLNRHSFLKVLEAASSRERHQQVWCLVRTFFLVQDGIFLLYPQKSEGLRECPGASFTRAVIALIRAPHSWPNHLPKPYLLIWSHWELGFNMSFGRRHSICSSSKWLDQGRVGS